MFKIFIKSFTAFFIFFCLYTSADAVEFEQANKFIQESIDSSHEFGIQSYASGDILFTKQIELSKLRNFVIKATGKDLIKYDLGPESFSSLIALRVLHDVEHKELNDKLIKLGNTLATADSLELPNRIHFFHNNTDFAADIDATSITAVALYKSGLISDDELIQYAKEVLKSRPEDGDYKDLLQVYWEDGAEPNRGIKFDPVVTANALYLIKTAQSLGLGVDDRVIEKNINFIVSHLQSGEYKNGTRYYPLPEIFLYFSSLLCDFKEFSKVLKPMIFEAMSSYLTSEVSPLEASLRILVAKQVDLDVDLKPLSLSLRSSLTNQGWQAGPFFKLGKSSIFFGSNTITSIFGLKAIYLLDERI